MSNDARRGICVTLSPQRVCAKPESSARGVDEAKCSPALIDEPGSCFLLEVSRLPIPFGEKGFERIEFNRIAQTR